MTELNICTVINNIKNIDIDEWSTYHLLIGISNIYVYTYYEINLNNIPELIRNKIHIFYINKNDNKKKFYDKELYDYFLHKNNNISLYFLNYCIKHECSKSSMILFLNTYQYLYLDNISINDLLHKCTNNDVFFIHKLKFGHSFVTKLNNNQSIINTYKYCNNSISNSGRFIVNLNLFNDNINSLEHLVHNKVEINNVILYDYSDVNLKKFIKKKINENTEPKRIYYELITNNIKYNNNMNNYFEMVNHCLNNKYINSNVEDKLSPYIYLIINGKPKKFTNLNIDHNEINEILKNDIYFIPKSKIIK
jgi:hypothetical protein